MAKDVFLQYEINLADEALYTQLSGAVDPGSNQAAGAIIRAPDGAAIEFSAPIQTRYEIFSAPCIRSDWFGTEENYPTNVATFTRKSGGWFGISWLFGETTRYYWRGVFRYTAPAPGGVAGEATAPLAVRRWIDGFEMPGSGEGGSASGSGDACLPAASRHPGGYGFRVDNSTDFRKHVPTENGAAATTELWERFYIRVNKFPNVRARIWQATGTPNTSAGMTISLGPSGEVMVGALNTSAAENVLGSLLSALELDTWYKIDLLYDIGGTFRVYLNGDLKFNMAAGSMGTNYGLNCANTSWVSCQLGSNTVSGHEGCWDFDDWIGCDFPTGADGSLIPGADWNHGSRIIILEPTALSATHGGFAGVGGASTGDWMHTFSRLAEYANGLANKLSSSTASDRAAVVLNIAKALGVNGSMGIGGFVVAKYGARAGAANGQLAYTIDDDAEVAETIVEGTSAQWNHIVWFPAAPEIVPPTFETFEIAYIAGADANARTVSALMACVELVGDFHPEDRVPRTDDPEGMVAGIPHTPAMLHNWPYEDSPWGKEGVAQQAPVIIHGGVYTGNGKETVLAFRAPVCFLMIRRTTSTAYGLQWFSSEVAGREPGTLRTQSDWLSQVLIDQNFAPAAEDDQSQQTLVRIVGNSVNVNAAGSVYQYIAFCDPGMRYCECGALRECVIGEVVTPKATSFEPEWTFFQALQQGSTSTGFFVHGPGAGSQELFKSGASALTAALEIVGADITTYAGSGIYSANYTNLVYAAFRKLDDSGDANAHKAIAITSYVGDGTASRTISLAPVTGRRPMWAMIIGSNGTCVYRDPSHTTVTSTTFPTTPNASTGITGGGIDSISVGSTLNTNGVTFDVLVFWAADATAGNNGWGTNGENIPVEPTAPVDTELWGEEPEAPSEPTTPTEPSDEGGDGGLTPGSAYSLYDFSATCIAYTVQIINMALQKIGISKQVDTAILTEVSAEAAAALLAFSDDLSAVLRDFPWGFATRYAYLDLVAGSAEGQDNVQAWSATAWYMPAEVVRVSGVDYYCLIGHTNHTPPNATYWSLEPPEEANGDWLYRYRSPNRMMLARRVVNPAKTRRDWDPNPPKFRTTGDDRGFLIETNEQNPELEYTVRPICATATDDALFRDALAWRHAHSLAGPLGREEKLTTYCWEMYLATLERARRWSASEQQQDRDGDADWIAARN